MSPALRFALACLILPLLSMSGCRMDAGADGANPLGLRTASPLFAQDPQLPPRILSGASLLSRASGPLLASGDILWSIDPQRGIREIHPVTEAASDITLREVALLRPLQQPAEVVQPDLAALVVRSRQGPFALELFLKEATAPNRPGEVAWHHAGFFQRGHYDQLFAVSPERVIAWHQPTQRLDCWIIDSAQRKLTPAWQWPLPPHTSSLAIHGESLAIAVTDTEFHVNGRPRTGSGILLYGLGDSPVEPILHDRWAAPQQSPIEALHWVGSHGLVAVQGVALQVLQRTLRGRLVPGKRLQTTEWLRPLASDGATLLLKGASSIWHLSVRSARAPSLKQIDLAPLPHDAPMALLQGRLWYVDPNPPAPDLESQPPLTLGSASQTVQSHPLVSIRGLDLTQRRASGRPVLPGTGERHYPQDVVQVGEHLLVAMGEGGLVLVAPGSDPTDPFTEAQVIRQLPVKGDIQQLIVRDNWAYCTSSAGWQVLDLRNSAEPLLLPSMDHHRRGRGLAAVQGRRLLAADQQLTLMRNSQPGAIYDDLQYTLPDRATGLAVMNNRTYVACGNKGIEVLDTGEGHPVIILHQIVTGHHWGALATQGQLLAAVRNQNEVAIFDMARANAPELRGLLAPGGPVTALTIRDDQLFVGVRLSARWGVVRAYRLAPDGATTLLGSTLLHGPPTAIRQLHNSAVLAVAWGEPGGPRGVQGLDAHGGQQRIQRTGTIALATGTGPWCLGGSELWSATDALLTVVSPTSDPPTPVAQAPFNLDPTIWVPKERRRAQDTLLHPAGTGVLAVVRKQWVHLHTTSYGTIATDPWPLKASEHVLSAIDGHVLVWDHERLSYEVLRLQPDSAPQPLDAVSWEGTHPGTTAGAFEVVDGAVLVGSGGAVFATAEAFGGAWLFQDGKETDAIPQLQATAVAVVSPDTWAAAGERLVAGSPPQAVVILRQGGATMAEHLLPGPPDRLWLTPDLVVIAWWSGGITCRWPNGGEATLPGVFDGIQVVPNAPGSGAFELWVRESGSWEIQRWRLLQTGATP